MGESGVDGDRGESLLVVVLVPVKVPVSEGLPNGYPARRIPAFA